MCGYGNVSKHLSTRVWCRDIFLGKSAYVLSGGKQGNIPMYPFVDSTRGVGNR